MKKLSEIGTEVWPYLDTIEKPKCYMLDEPAADGHQMEILMSPAERRELVRAVFEYAWEEGQFLNLGLETELAKFLEEQGL